MLLECVARYYHLIVLLEIVLKNALEIIFKQWRKNKLTFKKLSDIET